MIKKADKNGIVDYLSREPTSTRKIEFRRGIEAEKHEASLQLARTVIAYLDCKMRKNYECIPIHD